MIRFVFIFLLLISVAKAEDNCVYQTQQVIENGKVKREESLVFIYLVATVIKNGMKILGVSLPEKM